MKRILLLMTMPVSIFFAGCATPPGVVSVAPTPFVTTLSVCTTATQAIAYASVNGYASEPKRAALVDSVIAAAKPICLGPAPTASGVSAPVLKIEALSAAVSALNAYTLTQGGKP